MEQQQKSFEGWAIVEIYGHTKAIGFVTTEYYGTACLFRIDTPALPEREYTLTRPAYTRSHDGDEQRWTPVGAKVKREAVPPSSQLRGVGAIFAMHPCTETVARAAIEGLIERPLILLAMPSETQQPLLVNVPSDEFDDDGDLDESEP